MLKKTIDNFFKNNIVTLGRLEHRNNSKTNEIKLLLAKHDCICGNPKEIKKSVESIKPLTNKL